MIRLATPLAPPLARIAATSVLAAVLLAPLMVTPAAAQGSHTEVGTLDCDISGGVGFIFGSSKEVRCAFTPAGGGSRDFYVGAINKFGLDIGVTTGGQMVWAVFAESTARRGALAGTYAGVAAEASIAVGLGANVLMGGSDRTIALQPLSIQGQTGLNVAAGVTELRLERAR